MEALLVDTWVRTEHLRNCKSDSTGQAGYFQSSNEVVLVLQGKDQLRSIEGLYRMSDVVTQCKWWLRTLLVPSLETAMGIDISWYSPIILHDELRPMQSLIRRPKQ